MLVNSQPKRIMSVKSMTWGRRSRRPNRESRNPLVRGNRHYSKSKVWQKGKIGEAGMRSII